MAEVYVSIQRPDIHLVSQIESMSRAPAADPKEQAKQIAHLAKLSMEIVKWCEGLESALKTIAEKTVFRGT